MSSRTSLRKGVRRAPTVKFLLQLNDLWHYGDHVHRIMMFMRARTHRHNLKFFISMKRCFIRLILGIFVTFITCFELLLIDGLSCSAFQYVLSNEYARLESGFGCLPIYLIAKEITKGVEEPQYKGKVGMTFNWPQHIVKQCFFGNLVGKSSWSSFEQINNKKAISLLDSGILTVLLIRVAWRYQIL